MAPFAVDQAAILADTSPFCRFAESGICEALADYLGPRLCLTSVVVGELEHRAKQATHRQLAELARREPPWTPMPIIGLEDAALQRADALAQGWRRQQERQSGQGRDARANLGEATTIVAAQERGYALILDEGKPKRFAVNKGLTVITTEDLAVELTAAKVVGPGRAFRIYERVYGNDRPAFNSAVSAAQAVLGQMSA
jgi:predicted nucleic acid-binding protein